MVSNLFSIKGKAPACVRDLLLELSLGGACEEAAREFRLRADLLPARLYTLTSSNQSLPPYRALREGCRFSAMVRELTGSSPSLITEQLWSFLLAFSLSTLNWTQEGDHKSFVTGNKQSWTHGTCLTSLGQQ